MIYETPLTGAILPHASLSSKWKTFVQEENRRLMCMGKK